SHWQSWRSGPASAPAPPEPRPLAAARLAFRMPAPLVASRFRGAAARRCRAPGPPPVRPSHRRRPPCAASASGPPPRCGGPCAASSCVRLVQATRLPDDAAMMMQRNRPAGLDMADRSLAPVNTPEDWAPDSWRQRPALQQPSYRDPEALDAALATLSSMPPLVTSWEILALKRQLAEAQEGRRFLLQGGDCAESFADCEPGLISNRLKVLLQMSLVLVHGLRMPVVRVGRFAGQYAKPRS